MSSPTPPSPHPPLPALELPANLPVEYVNVVRIAHSATELVFDFAHILPGVTPARIQSRIVMAPLAAKLFARALSENLSRYESSFGEIAIPSGGALADQLFRPPSHPEDPNPK